MIYCHKEYGMLRAAGTADRFLRVCTMHEIINDVFYGLAKQYDSDDEHHLVGEVDYHLLIDDKPYEGVKSHREALLFVFE